MREEMISYPLAVLAKEKGFREPTIYYYDQSEDLCSGSSRAEWNGKSEVLLSAPTQCLLQRWLREVHHIDIRIQPVLKPHLMYQIDRVFPNSPQFNSGANILFARHEWSGECESYELALERGLLHALTNLK